MDRRGIPAPPHKGRGATFNPKVRFESAQLDPFDDGWGSLVAARAEAPPPPTEVLPDASRTRDRPQRLARHPVRAVDQPLPRLRARLHLLLRAAEPRLSRPLARASTSRPRSSPSSTPAPLLERELARPGYRCQPIALGTNTDPYQPQERRLGITRAILEVLAQLPASGHDRHQVGRGDARPRPAGADGGRRARAGRDLGHHARSGARPHARAARRGAASPARGAAHPQRGGRADQRHGRAGHPGAERPRDRGGARGRGGGRRQPGGLRAPPPAARGQGAVHGLARGACAAARRARAGAGPPVPRRQARTIRPSAAGCAARAPMPS